MSTNTITCPECAGTGLVHTSEHTWEEDTCKSCEGMGELTQQIGDEKLTREELDHI